MFKLKLKNEAPNLDAVITRVLTEMYEYGPEAPEYPDLLEKLERLMKMKTKSRRSRVSRDTIFTVLGNLAGIVAIVAYEQKHVFTSKGMDFVKRPK